MDKSLLLPNVITSLLIYFLLFSSEASTPTLFKTLGMDLSTATGIFYRQALRCHGLPFEVKVDEPNATTYAAMEAADKGEDMFGPFDSVGDLMEALNA